MLCHLMRNKLPSVGAELGKDRCIDVEKRELNDTENLLHRSFRWLSSRENFQSI